MLVHQGWGGDRNNLAACGRVGSVERTAAQRLWGAGARMPALPLAITRCPLLSGRRERMPGPKSGLRDKGAGVGSVCRLGKTRRGSIGPKSSTAVVSLLLLQEKVTAPSHGGALGMCFVARPHSSSGFLLFYWEEGLCVFLQMNVGRPLKIAVSFLFWINSPSFLVHFFFLFF